MFLSVRDLCHIEMFQPHEVWNLLGDSWLGWVTIVLVVLCYWEFISICLAAVQPKYALHHWETDDCTTQSGEKGGMADFSLALHRRWACCKICTILGHSNTTYAIHNQIIWELAIWLVFDSSICTHLKLNLSRQEKLHSEFSLWKQSKFSDALLIACQNWELIGLLPAPDFGHSKNVVFNAQFRPQCSDTNTTGKWQLDLSLCCN